MREEIETPGDGQIRAMVTIAGNPVLSTPDGAGLARALDGLEFMVAVDIYLNETTRHADVILPPTSALERDHYDLVFHGSRSATPPGSRPAVFAKPDDARHDWEIFRDLTDPARRRGSASGSRTGSPRKARLAASPATVVDRAAQDRGPDDDAALRAHPEGVDLGPLRPTMPERLQTADQRIDLAPGPARRRPRAGAAPRRRPRPRGRRAAAHRPAAQAGLQLLAAQHQPAHPRPAAPPPADAPADLADRGIADGALVARRLAGRRGRGRGGGADDMMPGVVSLPHGYGHQVDGTRLVARLDGRRASRSTTSPTPSASTSPGTPRSTASP